MVVSFGIDIFISCTGFDGCNGVKQINERDDNVIATQRQLNRRFYRWYQNYFPHNPYNLRNRGSIDSSSLTHLLHNPPPLPLMPYTSTTDFGKQRRSWM